MGKYTKISQEAFEQIQVEAGVILNKFNPANPDMKDEDIITATTGGVNPSCVPTYEDFAEDVDNAPVNLKEFKRLTGWDCKMATTALGASESVIKLALGASDANEGKITPRRELKDTDFSDIWWVGDISNGGFLAIRLINALSTGGFSLQTSKNGKGNIALELTGHVSSEEQDVVPMEFYLGEPDETDETDETQETQGE